MKYSSKVININTLSSISEKFESDQIVIYTDFGLVIGKPYLPKKDSKLENIVDMFAITKSNLIEDLKSQGSEISEDGAIICLKDAKVKYGNSKIINFGEFILHADHVSAFFPISNKDYQTFLDQIENQ
nr:hypothetical protein [Clostridioides sp.]